MSPIKASIPAGVQAIALFEAAKGLLVLVAGFGLLRLADHDLEAVGEELLGHLHLNPARRLPQIFLHALDSVGPSSVRWLAAGAAAYSALRFTEAYGLWRGRDWATWIAVVSTALYLPVEAYHLIHHFSALKAGITVFNLLLLFYLLKNRHKKSHSMESV